MKNPMYILYETAMRERTQVLFCDKKNGNWTVVEPSELGLLTNGRAVLRGWVTSSYKGIGYRSFFEDRMLNVHRVSDAFEEDRNEIPRGRHKTFAVTYCDLHGIKPALRWLRRADDVPDDF